MSKQTEKAKNVWKLTYIDVILRTSGFAMALGAAVAVLIIGVSFNWINFLAGFLVLVLMQGLAQHSLDTIMDQAPVDDSAFRKFASKAFTEKELYRIYKYASVAATVVVLIGVLLIKHYLIIFIFLLGLFCIYQYARTNIEWYSAFAFAAAAIGGYLTQADLNYVLDWQQFLIWNMPICALFFFLFGFYKIGQILYRTDDYQREMCPKHHIWYARRNLRCIHHQTQWPLFALIFAIAGYYANYWVYSVVSLIMVLIFYGIWFSTRHSTCNNVSCKKNAVRKMRVEERKKQMKEEGEIEEE